MNAIAAIEGSGDHRILVLHGWALDSSVWLTARARTDQSRFTYAYLDFPGYGVNRPEAPADGIDGMAAVALDAADQLGWSTFSVLGHSMGGTTALRVATLAPERVTSVVALTPVSPAGTPLDEATYGSFAGAWADPGAAIRGALAPHIDETDLKNLVDRNRSTMDQATWESYLKNWTSPDFLDRMGTYEGPTTLIVGESDPFVTAEYLGDTLAALKNGNLKTIRGKAGHYPMVENAPETVALSEQSLY
ncbi:alpha/beta hydrolase [Rhodococcus sp. IEGM 1307]|uniref:alpha/beta fold hydrolase n=1 Tax=Rhodococcus sp. IEGM 1307 TaxID=3047091 RepID=UPI0024B7EC11|nr:alpha/beta hydrolase [Rhodococcus sp. IEGM 1307]MDI9975607.1 alpha/beta hydrolase [Rhodococcus sp. IEGM 1307]